MPRQWQHSQDTAPRTKAPVSRSGPVSTRGRPGLIVNQLVRRRPKVENDTGKIEPVRTALRHEDTNQLLRRVNPARCAESAIPTEAPRYVREIVARGDKSQAEAPAMPVPEVLEERRSRLLLRRKLVHG